MPRQVIAIIHAQGIEWQDYKNDQRMGYYTQDNTLTILNEPREFELAEMESMQYLRSVVEPYIEKLGQVTRHGEIFEGQWVEVCELEHVDRFLGRMTVKFLVDQSNKLPVRVRYVSWDDEGNPRYVKEGRCDYPSEGPLDIYALGVPADAVIIDKRAPQEVREIIDLGKMHKDKFEATYTDYIFVYTKSFPSDITSAIYVVYVHGNLQRWEWYECQVPLRTINEFGGDIYAMIDWAKTNKPVLTYLGDGQIWPQADYWNDRYDRVIDFGYEDCFPRLCCWSVATGREIWGRVRNLSIKMRHIF